MMLPLGKSGLTRQSLLLTGISLLVISGFSFLLMSLSENKSETVTTLSINDYVISDQSNSKSSAANEISQRNVIEDKPDELNFITKVTQDAGGNDLEEQKNIGTMPTVFETNPTMPTVPNTDKSAGSLGTRSNNPIDINTTDLSDILKSLNNASNLDNFNNQTNTSSAYGNGENKDFIQQAQKIAILGLPLISTFYAGGKTNTNLKYIKLRKQDLGMSRKLTPYASGGLTYTSGKVGMIQNQTRNENFFNRPDGKNNAIQFVVNAGVSYNLGKGFALYSGLSSETNASTGGSKDSIKIRIPTSYFTYLNTRGDVIFKKARTWKDSFLISATNPSANYIDVPLGISKTISLPNKYNLTLAVQGSLGVLTSSKGNTVNPYAYDHPTFWKEIEGINTSSDYIIESKDLLNKTRATAGVSMGLEKVGMQRTHGLKVSVNQSLQNQFTSSSGLNYTPTRIGVEYSVKFNLFKAK